MTVARATARVALTIYVNCSGYPAYIVGATLAVALAGYN